MHFQNLKIDKNILIIALNLVISLCLINFLPFSQTENKGLALLFFVGVLWLTEAIDIVVTALFIPVLVVFLGLSSTTTALVGFSNPIIFLFLGGFALATALKIQNIDSLIANKIIKFAKGNLNLALLYLFITTAVLSMWMSNTATTAMILPLVLGLLAKLPQKNTNIYAYALLGIAYSASIGGMSTLIGSPPNAIIASLLHISFHQWLWYGLPIVAVLLPIMIALLYLIFRPKLNHIDENFQDQNIKLNKKGYITIFIFSTTAILWIFSGVLNPILVGILGLNSKIASLDTIIALLCIVAIVLSKVSTWTEISRGTQWGVLILFGGGLTLSHILKTSGASQILANGVVFLIEGGNYFVIGLVVAAFIVFLTEFTSNTASTALLAPIFISIAQTLHVNPLGLSLIIGFGASCAFMLPIATPPNAIVFSTGEIHQRDMLKVGFLLNILSIFIIVSFAYFFWF